MQSNENGEEAALPIRLAEEGRVATWNPGLVRAARVVLRVRDQHGVLSERATMNSGRARVRVGEWIEAVRAEAGGSSA